MAELSTPPFRTSIAIEDSGSEEVFIGLGPEIFRPVVGFSLSFPLRQQRRQTAISKAVPPTPPPTPAPIAIAFDFPCVGTAVASPDDEGVGEAFELAGTAPSAGDEFAADEFSVDEETEADKATEVDEVDDGTELDDVVVLSEANC